MGAWFIRPLGDDAEQKLVGGAPAPAFIGREPVEAGQYVCDLCGQPLVPCDLCGQPALCGFTWCELCQPLE